MIAVQRPFADGISPSTGHLSGIKSMMFIITVRTRRVFTIKA